MEGTIVLAAGDYRLALAPRHGGSIARFDWRDEPVMRATCGPSIFDTACFPLVPFSNRIAYGRFRWAGREVQLAPNFPGRDHPHTLHGFGWLARWKLVEQGPDRAVVRHRHEADAWPWTYEAEQRFSLADCGFTHSLLLRNLGESPMPAGMGLHPYFPRTARTRYRGLHRGEWKTSEDGLPVELLATDQARDWWDGQPVGARAVDTVYVGREGPIRIEWPERSLALTIEPSPTLGSTVVYAPLDADFFCVEPVSHATDALNRSTDHPSLAPGEAKEVQVRYSLTATDE